MSSTAASGESERPTKLAIGQRWRCMDSMNWLVTAVVGNRADVVSEPDGIKSHANAGSILTQKCWRYLGGPSPAVPQEGPGVRVGQRWKWNDGTHTIGKVSASGTSCELHLASGQTNSEWPISGDRPAGALGLIADAPPPSVTPATPTRTVACRQCDWTSGGWNNDDAAEWALKWHVRDKHAPGELRTPEGVPLSALGAIQAKKKPEPWVPTVDDDHWIPGVGERGWR